MLLVVIIFILCCAYLFYWRKRTVGNQAQRVHRGDVMILDTSDIGQLTVSKALYVFAPATVTTKSSATITLGFVEEQNGNQAKILLVGDFSWVDDNTIREVVNDGHDHPERIYRIGQEMPVTQRFFSLVDTTVRYAKIIHIHSKPCHSKPGVWE